MQGRCSISEHYIVFPFVEHPYGLHFVLACLMDMATKPTRFQSVQPTGLVVYLRILNFVITESPMAP